MWLLCHRNRQAVAATCSRYQWYVMLEAFSSMKTCSTWVWDSVWMSVHSWRMCLCAWVWLLHRACICMNMCAWERLCLRELSGRTGGKKTPCSWHISATLHDGGKRESMYPCSANYDPSPSLSHSISLLRLPPGQRWFNDERETILIIHTQQTSPLAVLLSHTHTHMFQRQKHARNTHTKTNRETLALHTRTVCKRRHTHRMKKQNNLS